MWTSSPIEHDARLVLRISFASPAEVHDVAARVVWTRRGGDAVGGPIFRYGLEWEGPSPASLLRLRLLAHDVAPGVGHHPLAEALRPARQPVGAVEPVR
jgi:hypothetical protein